MVHAPAVAAVLMRQAVHQGTGVGDWGGTGGWWRGGKRRDGGTRFALWREEDGWEET